MSPDIRYLIYFVAGSVLFALMIITQITRKKKNSSLFEAELIRQGFTIDQKIEFENICVYFDYGKKQFCVQRKNQKKNVLTHEASSLTKFVVYDEDNIAIQGKANSELRGLYLSDEDGSVRYDYQRRNKRYFLSLRIYVYTKFKSTPYISPDILSADRSDSDKFLPKILKLDALMTALVKVMNIKLLDMAAMWERDEEAFKRLEKLKNEGKISEDELNAELMKMAENYRA